MKRQILIAATWLALILFVSTVGANGQAPAPASTPSPSPSSSPIDVMYTGRLLGYFRVPSLQKFSSKKGCLADDGPPSYAAKMFLERRNKQENMILVGTGDNFAPHLEARVFSEPPERTGNKELYFGKKDDWVFYKDLKKHPDLVLDLEEGRGVIPNDNVACFLRAAKFDAVVPGKHDFYFGAERLRQLARFLAGKGDDKYKPVQMLGANLVLKTTRIDGATPDPIEQRDVGDWPDEYPVLNLNEGQSVYPWFSQVKIELKTKDAFEGKEVTLCRSDGAPNQMPVNIEQCPKLLDPQVVKVHDHEWKLIYKLPRLEPNGKKAKGEHFSTLIPGANYGLCIKYEKEKKLVKGCLRFSTHTPFFYFPHPAPLENEHGYTDPDPLLVVNDRVAIFGVVDPDLNEQVGVLNFGWLNKKGNLTTRVSVEDPAEALQQQLDYFEELKPGFTGLKILLVQASPQRARSLASKFPQFQMVVTAAEQEQSTSEVDMSTVWDPRRHRRAFMAVPAPYFDPKTNGGSVYFGTIKATEQAGKWSLQTLGPTAKEYLAPVQIESHEDKATEFWTRVKDEVQECLPANFPKLTEDRDKPEKGDELSDYLKWLVLCAMREKTGADVALIQSRDLFTFIPQPQANDPMLPRARAGQNKAELDQHIQQTLDSLIWKGDLLTLLYVPGSDLKNALQQSARYDAEERASLSLVLDRGRKLEMLGVRKDGGEYFINDLPLDEKRVYGVATTDYLAAGDTGYRDLVNAALNPRTHPAAFDGKLTSISSLVCRRFFDKETEALQYCLGPIKSHDYLDETTATQIPQYKEPSLWKRAWKAVGIEWPHAGTDAKLVEDAIEQTVQRREIWRFSLQNLSLGFKTLNNNFTDDEVDEKFDGVPLTGVTAHESQTFNLGLDTRLSRSSHKRELFFAVGIGYEKQSVGDDPSEFDISLADNRLFGEAGFVFWRKPGRAHPNIGLNVSLYTETHFKGPFSVFTLANGDDKRIDRDRSLQVLPRVGVRWENKANSFEIGAQTGYEINALSGYVFNTEGAVAECLVDSGVSFTKCINKKSDPNQGGTITKKSEVKTLFDNRPRAGMYWKTRFSVSLPFTSKVKYELEQTADFFFVNFGRDTSVDTRFRDISKHRLSFIIWPSISVGPTLDLLLYQNKINRDFLFQRQFGIETKVSFDIFNRREKGVQFKHQP